MKILENIKKNKYTTGTGLIVLALVALKAFNIDVSQKVGINIGDLAEIIGSAISGIMLLVAKDPEKKDFKFNTK